MSESTLVLYKECKIIPDKNFLVDGIDYYLMGHVNKKTINNFQYIKHALELEIKLDLNQVGSDFSTDGAWNYCSILNNDTGAKKVYYFIINKEWKGQETIKLSLYMDTINTFSYNSDYHVSQKTKILREHKDRFELADVIYQYEQLGFDSSNVPITWEVKNGNTYIQAQVTMNSLLPEGADLLIDYEDHSTFQSAYTEYNSELLGYFIDSEDRHILYLKFCYYGLSSGLVDSSEWQIYLNIQGKNKAQHLVRKIDYFSEGLNPILYKKDEMDIRNQDVDMSWNLVYKGATTPDVYLIPEKNIDTKYNSTDTNIVINQSSINDDEWIIFQYGYDDPRGEYGFMPSDLIIEVDGKQYTPWQSSSIKYISILNGFAFHKPSGQSYLEFYTFIQRDFRAVVGWENLEKTLITTNISAIKIVNPSHKVNALKVLTASLSDSYTSPNTTYNIPVANTWVTLNSINQIDRTDSTLIKIIKLPYCPSNFSFNMNDRGLILDSNWKYDSLYNAFKMIDVGSNFEASIQCAFDDFLYKDIVVGDGYFNKIEDSDSIDVESISKFDNKNIKYESKLFHSSYYQKKFVYDSFSFVFQEEKVDPAELIISIDRDTPYYLPKKTIPPFTFSFVSTNTINSKFMFKFPTYKLKLSEEDYDHVLPIARNNEVVIYNSNYIDYLRTAYNYDIKAKERTEKLAGLQFGVNAGVGALKVASSVASGNLLNGVGSAIGYFGSTLVGYQQMTNTIAQAEENIERKIASMKAQAVSVAGSDDVDLLVNYSGNRAKICTYEVSSRVKNMLWKLFYYTGYATAENGIPNLQTRLWFNFIQADLVVDVATKNLPEPLMKNIIERFSAGVTNLHRVTETDDDNVVHQYWDFEQEKENWEISLLEHLNVN